KQEHRMGRNRLSGELGDDVNAILSAAGMNFRKLIRRLADFFVFILGRHISGFWPVQPVRAFAWGH
ncbi:MAG: IS5/IS1182 family transposase, partial [Acidobacteria bacterium]|nr:IS5/IS1182 family transposase [Acidobacteriota bacterium]